MTKNNSIAPTATAKAAARIIDTTQLRTVKVDRGEVRRYRVLRPIRHGKLDLVVGDLVDMPSKDASHLVETQALVAHVVPEQVSRVVALDGDAARITAVSAELTGAEVAGELAAPGAQAPDLTMPVAEVTNQGNVALT